MNEKADLVEYVTTHQLREGDIIRTHGMRLLIDRRSWSRPRTR